MTRAMELAAQLAAAEARGSVKEIPGLTERLVGYETEMVKLRQQPFVDREIRRRRVEAEARLRKDIGELVDQARKAHLRGFDQEEGQLRARARATGADATDAQVRAQVMRGERARQLATLVDHASTPAAARQVYAEAVLTDDVDTIRLVGMATQRRLSALAAVDKTKDISALRNEAVGFQGEFDRWAKTHPSTTQRLAEIDRQRGAAALEFDASADFALRLFGIEREKPAPSLRPLPEVTP